ncbi:hypothetical protein WR25_10270 [Diploscapter pachys]|uniref:Uncharacterized protein n=1 Tax=Diploscapter pachys TaxID=2018661 RepID=A0A2A2LFU3_9BILA|nr:hypothetical protein WR25_10270 [Diploscapter pachys]
MDVPGRLRPEDAASSGGRQNASLDSITTRKPVRPNFAEDVYGEKGDVPEKSGKTPPTSSNFDSNDSAFEDEGVVSYSESPLAQRRSANLLKLQQLKGTIIQR